MMKYKWMMLTMAMVLATAIVVPVSASENTAKTELTSGETEELVSESEDDETETKARNEKNTYSKTWDGDVLTASAGVVYGPTGKETYYNLDMSGVVEIMRSMGNTDEYWVREDGVKMLGDYVMVAANLDKFPRGSLVECSLGTAIVCDTGSFAAANPTQLDIAVTW